jgi:hypothetical protein
MAKTIFSDAVGRIISDHAGDHQRSGPEA